MHGSVSHFSHSAPPLPLQVRERLPSVAISSDFISGFCGESEEDHQETLSLMEEVRYEKAFMFAYSLREKTHAHRKLSDDVPEAVKKRRLREVIEVFNAGAREANDEEVGRHHRLVDQADHIRWRHVLAIFREVDHRTRLVIITLHHLQSV